MPNREQLDRLEARDKEMWRLYIEHSWTQAMIADKFDLTQKAVSKRLEIVREHFPPLTKEEVVKRRLEQLDMLVRGSVEKARHGDKDAVNNIVKLWEREAKLLGLDAPTKQQVEQRMVRYEITDGDADD